MRTLFLAVRQSKQLSLLVALLFGAAVMAGGSAYFFAGTITYAGGNYGQVTNATTAGPFTLPQYMTVQCNQAVVWNLCHGTSCVVDGGGPTPVSGNFRQSALTASSGPQWDIDSPQASGNLLAIVSGGADAGFICNVFKREPR